MIYFNLNSDFDYPFYESLNHELLTLESYHSTVLVLSDVNISCDAENFNLLPYVEWDRFVTLTGAQAE
jgi:hypothetical protein